MHPELFHIGSLTIYTYGALFAVGLILAAIMAGRRAHQIHLNSNEVLDLIVWTGFVGLLGSRLAYIGAHFSYYVEYPFEILQIWKGGLIFYGGVAGSLFYLWFYARHRAIPYLQVIDFLVPYVALAHGVGRIGCYFNGCCYGSYFEGLWAVRFPFLDHPVHPVQLYEAIAAFLLFGFLLRLDVRKKWVGEATFAYFSLYAAARFVLEFYRGDKAHDLLIGWTATQLICVFIFFVTCVLYFSLRLKRR